MEESVFSEMVIFNMRAKKTCDALSPLLVTWFPLPVRNTSTSSALKKA